MTTICFKKRTWILPVLSLVFAACVGGPKNPVPEKGPHAQTAPYEAIIFNKTTVLFPDQGKKSPRMELSLILLDPAGDELLKSLLYEGLSPEEYAAHLIRDYEDSYFDVRTQTEDPDIRSSAVLNWTYKELHKVQAYSRLQVIGRFKEYYTGGAHGMREKNYFVIDLVEKKQIRLKDLFLEGTKEALKTRVEDALRAYSSLEPGAPLSSGYYFNDSVEPSENFFLTTGGIGFYWDPYEIAPYSVGPVKIIIPYADIEDLLNPRGKFLISQLN
ncbi:RsiV family protein [Treponema sp. TIM-1]|uniref:RsiV family protein n=1 Tax=Treponema sp. TIM-1 TaxID=2898417 RepID=UPI00397EA1E4